MESDLPSYPNAPASQVTNPAFSQPIAGTNPAAAPLQPYVSNPFRATLYGLGNMLERNPLSTLTVLPRILLRALIVIIIAAVLGILAAVAGKVFAILAVLAGVVGLIYVGIIAYAATTAVQSASQNGTPITGKEAVDAFGKRKLFSLVVASVLAVILVSIGLLLLVVPGLIILARLSLIPFVIYNEDLKALDAIKRSWHLTSGHVWEILGIHAAQIVTISGSGGLLAFSAGAAGLAKSYQQLLKYEAAGTPTGPTHKANYILVIVLALLIPLYIGFNALIVAKSNQLGKKRADCAVVTSTSSSCDSLKNGTELNTPASDDTTTDDSSTSTFPSTDQ